MLAPVRASWCTWGHKDSALLSVRKAIVPRCFPGFAYSFWFIMAIHAGFFILNDLLFVCEETSTMFIFLFVSASLISTDSRSQNLRSANETSSLGAGVLSLIVEQQVPHLIFEGEVKGCSVRLLGYYVCPCNFIS